jgi:hypothetical protein
MSSVEMLRRRLEEAYRGSKHHSFLSSLKGVSEEMAAWQPPHYRGFPHMNGSILNLAYHTGGDKHVLISCAFGDGSVTWDQVQNRFEELGGNLSAAKALAEEGHTLVLATLDSLTDEDLDQPRPYYGGKTHTAYEVFSIVAEHDVYHAGQVNFVRCLLAGL